MNITLDIPEDLERRLQAKLGDLSRRALEAVAVEAYRSQIIAATEVQRMLSFSSRLATDAFLKQHGAYLHYTEADLEQDIQALDQVLKSNEGRL